MSKKQKMDQENTLPDYDSLFEKHRAEKNVSAKILYSFFKQNYKEFLLSFVFFFAKNIGVWVIPIVMANVINIATDPAHHSLNEFWLNGAVAFVVLFQNIPFNALYVKMSSRALRNIGAGLRNSLIRKLQHLSLTYHKEIESGRLQSKFIRDIEAIEFLNNQMIMNLIPALVNVLVTIIITAQKSLLVTAFYFVMIPANLILINIFRNKMRNNNQDFRQEVESMSAKISDMIEMIPITKAHGLEDEEIKKLENNIKRLKGTGLRLDRTNGYFGSMNWVLTNVFSCSCLILTGVMAYFRMILPGDIMMYQTYFNVIMGQAQMLIAIYPEFLKGMESLRSVSEIMLSDDIEDNRDKIRLRYVHGTVQFSHVNYHYPHTDKMVIQDFSLDVEPGECVAFVGASGSGKSTIMNMIIGFLKPDAGEMKIDGKPIELLNLQDYRKFIAVVPQNSILFTGTIRENILYGMGPVSEQRLNEVVELANIKEFIDKMPDGLDTLIGEHGGKLSGGQKQRIPLPAH